MSNGALRFIAKLSYGMYVWHLVVRRLILAHMSIPESPTPHGWWMFYGLMAGGTLCGTILVALMSWHVIELPFLRLKRLFPSA